MRTSCVDTDFSTLLPEDLESELKQAAEISMGTEISPDDMLNISYLCDQIISISEYRTQLYDYLKNRMSAIAPNLTCLVGELVGARLIAHAGSLLNLAKHPASTVQILGAEKALFRALKTKHDTPKYGLIYHASLVGQAGPKIKGKIARAVATKAALSIRVDALGDKDTMEVGVENRTKVEMRLKQLEGKLKHGFVKEAGKGKAQQKKFEMKETKVYNAATDIVMAEPSSEPAAPAETATVVEKKDKKEKKEKKDKKEKKGKKEEVEEKEEEKEKEEAKVEETPNKKKRKAEAEPEVAEGDKKDKKKKKDKKEKK